VREEIQQIDERITKEGKRRGSDLVILVGQLTPSAPLDATSTDSFTCRSQQVVRVVVPQ
jgi:hypothetical protein